MFALKIVCARSIGKLPLDLNVPVILSLLVRYVCHFLNPLAIHLFVYRKHNQGRSLFKISYKAKCFKCKHQPKRIQLVKSIAV